MPKQPYVRYRIYADGIKDVGIGIAVKRAIDAFLKTHKYEGRITMAEKSSDRFEAILQIFPGGNPDLMINALMEHITKSGRLPTNTNYKPDIRIDPVPCDAGINLVKESPDTDAFQRTIDDLHTKLTGYEEENANLSRALGAKQKTIDERSTKISELEKRLGALSKITLAEDPFHLLSQLYLPRVLDDLVDASGDWETLVDIEDEKLFLSQPKDCEIGYVEYIKRKFKLNFKENCEFERWKKMMLSTKSLEDFPEYIELRDKIARLEADSKVYELAKLSGVSEDTLKTLLTIVERNKPVLSDLTQRVEGLSREFESSRLSYELFASKDPEEAYRRLTGVIKDSADRLQRKVELPILVTTKPGTDSRVLRFYVPTFDSSSRLERHIYSLIQSSLAREKDCTLSDTSYSDQVRILDTSDKGKKLAMDYSLIIGDSILNALGLTPKLLTVGTLR